jgi:glutaredoxin
MSAAPVLLYTRTGCPYCDAKRAELAARGVSVREINVSERPEAVAELLKVTRGRRVVPVVVEGGRIAIAPGGGSAF